MLIFMALSSEVCDEAHFLVVADRCIRRADFHRYRFNIPGSISDGPSGRICLEKASCSPVGLAGIAIQLEDWHARDNQMSAACASATNAYADALLSATGLRDSGSHRAISVSWISL